jgi:spermidine synthase
MTNRAITVKIVKEVEVEPVIRLYKDAGWWEDDFEPSFIPEMVTGSRFFAVAEADGMVVGMGRALSDGSSDAYIQDVVVLKEYRGHGIGSKIIREIIAALKADGVDWIGLIGEPGTQSFYEKLGFHLMKGYVPMKLD